LRCEDARDRLEEARLGLLVGDEAGEFASHLESCAGCSAAMAEVRAFTEILDLARDAGRDDAFLDELLRVRRRSNRRRMWLYAASVAAVLLLAVVLVTRGPSRLEAGVETTLAAGERVLSAEAEITGALPSRLTAIAGGRRVRLFSGAARFEVDPGHGPFAVITPAGEVRVVGTSFEVRIMKKSQWIAGSVVVAVAVAAGIVVFSNDHGEVEGRPGDLLVAVPGSAPVRMTAEEVADLVVSRRELEAENRELRQQIEDSAATAEEAPSPVAETDADSVPGAPEGVPAAIAATDWDRMGQAVADLVMAEEGDEEVSEAELLVTMGWLMGRLRAIGSELEIDDPNEVFGHPQVFPVFMDGLLKSLIPGAGEAKRKEVVSALAGIAVEPVAGAVEAVLAIEKRLKDLKIAVEGAARLRGQLDDDQILRVFQVLASERLGGRGVSSVGASTEAALGNALAAMYGSRFEVEGADLEALTSLLPGFVSSHLAARVSVTAEFGAGAVEQALLGIEEPGGGHDLASRVQDARVQIALYTPQAEMERELYLRASEELRRRMKSAGLSIFTFHLSGGK
jgi:ferric-dicitrate binding protein FerR (iron transport regulator)